MVSQANIIASLPNAQLSLGALLRHLHNQGRLRPLILETLLAQLVREQARHDGLSVSAEELQVAADAFRRIQGLNKAADTHFWLALRGMTVDGFEDGLEESLLAVKLKQHLTNGRANEYFAAHQRELERWQFAQVLVGRDDLAREMASQIRDEGRDLESVVQEHGLHAAHHQMFHKQRNGALAEAMDAAKTGELVGPIETPQGFALVRIDERRPAELDAATREHIQNELFAEWMTEQMKEAEINLSMLETAG